MLVTVKSKRGGRLFGPLAAAIGVAHPESWPSLPVAVVLYNSGVPSASDIARLERCAAAWKATPALWVEKPDYAGIVQVRSVTHGEHGFQVTADIEEILLAGKGLKAKTRLHLGCSWDDNMATITEEVLSAPYCFSLRFEHDAIVRLRQVWALLPVDKNGRKRPFPNLFNSCFRVGRSGGLKEEQFLALLAALHDGRRTT